MKRLLFIAHRIPFPPNKGDKIRSYNILQFLSAHYTIDIAFLVDDISDLQYLDELKQFASSIFYEVIPTSKKITAAISAFFQKTPISIPYFYSKELQNSIDSHLNNNIPSCVFCFSSPTAEYFFRSRHADQLKQSSRIIMDLIDLDSLKWSQYAQHSNPFMGQIYNREARLLARYEEKIAQEFDALLLVTESERRLCPPVVRKKVTVVSNGVDLVKFVPQKRKAKPNNEPVIVFTGAMDYWPNIDAVVWFSRDIFPLVLATEPSVRFFIVGSNPKPEVLALSKEGNIIITGFVEDISEYIATADVCVAPLRVARGIQNKVLEAMAMGKAVVATPEAIEGISEKGAQQVMVAHTAEQFAKAIVYLLHEENARLALGTAARETMELHYSWAKNLAKLSPLMP
ncbi:MAG: TIGR03087 family PEP-CTERM/XrtA system glycosyltransferase [Desulfobulbus sp.]